MSAGSPEFAAPFAFLCINLFINFSLNVMQGVVFDIKHYAVHDGPGIRQTIFFKGCPMRCQWCHNPESQSAQIEKYCQQNHLGEKVFMRDKKIGWVATTEELLKEIEKDVVFFEESGGGVTFSGGEPLEQFDFVYDLAYKCKERGIHTAIDTCGYAGTKQIDQLTKVIDLFLYDLKLIDSEEHYKYTGVENDLIISNLRFLDMLEQEVIVRFPLIPDITTRPENVKGMVELMSSLTNIKKIDVLPYHNIAKEKYTRFGKPFSLDVGRNLLPADVTSIRQQFLKAELEVKTGT